MMQPFFQTGRPGSALTFLRGFRHQPRDVGTCLPSGPYLARQIAALATPAPKGPIIELGPRTGPVTRALLERGVTPDRLMLIEYGRTFIPYLQQAFPDVALLQADAFDLARICARRGIGEVACVVSGLPMLNFPAAKGQRLIADACRLLAPGGVFVQITYAQSPPVEPPKGVEVSLGKRVWLNAPPASLWLYRANNT